GLRGNQQLLDVVGNNLANVNTIAFKSQSVLFADLLYQTQERATGGSSTSGGTNPIQVGYGTTTSTIDSDFSQGALTVTGGPLDLAIQGNGFFVVNDGAQNLYTRDGAFQIDGSNNLVDAATGFKIQRFGTLGEASP